MKILHKATFMKLLFVALLTHLTLASKAQLSASVPYRSDTTFAGGQTISESQINFLLNYGEAKKTTAAKLARTTASFMDVSDRQLQKTISLKLSKPQERKLLMAYFKQLQLDDKLTANQANKKIYYRFANLFARLKMYPLAMKCFLKTIRQDKKKDAMLDNPSVPGDALSGLAANLTGEDDDDLPINSKDDSLITQQAQSIKSEKSVRTTYSRIINTFNDNKTAVAYAMLFHVKQPAPGKKKIFVVSNTGHTFITLIKYNSDSTYVSCSFGFYPKKEQPFSGTPVFPATASQFKSDAGHQWDEVVGKFISKKKFERVLGLTKRYNDLEYHLNSNNCTDFCLKAATLAGINIDNTAGKWPLGHGNTPGLTGQSIYNGTYSNADPDAANSLFSTLNLSLLP